MVVQKHFWHLQENGVVWPLYIAKTTFFELQKKGRKSTLKKHGPDSVHFASPPPPSAGHPRHLPTVKPLI